MRLRAKSVNMLPYRDMQLLRVRADAEVRWLRISLIWKERIPGTLVCRIAIRLNFDHIFYDYFTRDVRRITNF